MANLQTNLGNQLQKSRSKSQKKPGRKGRSALPKVRGSSVPPHIKRREEGERFVIFNIGDISVPNAWNELRSFLNPEVFKGIKSLERISIKNRPPRLDMWVSQDIANGLKRTITSMTRQRTPKFVRAVRELAEEEVRFRCRPLSLWRIDMWKSWRDRNSTASAPVIAIPKTQWRDRIATLNINGLLRKRLDVTAMLEKEQIGICALQETLISARAFPVHVQGYTSYVQHWGEGFRGQAILVKNHLSSYEVGREPKLYIHIKVSGLSGVKQPVHVIAVYLPSGGWHRGERTQLITKILALNRKILTETPGAPVILLGDWNEEPKTLMTKLQTNKTGLRIYRPVGSALTRFPTKGQGRAIDHMVVSAGAYRLFKRPKVFREYGMSDHRPVIAVLRAVVQDEIPPAPQWRYDTYAIKRYARELVHSNRWSLLEVEEATNGDELNESTECFIRTMDQVSKSLGIKKLKVPGKPKFPKKLKKLMLARNKAAERLAEAVLRGAQPSKSIRNRFRKTQERFSKARDAWQLQSEQNIIKYTCRDIQACDYKKVWARLKSKIEHDGASEALQPIRNNEGVLCVTTEDILEAIADHYDRLANADPGPSQDREHWANIDLGEEQPELINLNDDLTWIEVLLSIRRMNRNTAPGITGEHVNIMKELLKEECMAKVREERPRMQRPEGIVFALGKHELPQFPLTPLGKTFFKIITSIWRLEQIPDAWNDVLICNLFKSGDPELMVNYRGISLISVGLKVLLGVMANRLYDACESAQLLVPEQAGFRRREEAVAQFIAMAEIVRRRGIEAESTFAIFVDFKKAYDKVHHEALYRILDNMGVRGKFLTIIKDMYQNSRMQIKAGGRVTRSFGMQRGTRQGCPLSPLLFIIFVNHLLKETSCGGVTVPGVRFNFRVARCGGGQYADDLVALETTPAAAKTFCENIYNWGVKWGMELGIKKCGVMLWSDSEIDKIIYDATDFTTPDGDLPKVDEYKYLGITMNKNLPKSRAYGGNELDHVKLQAAKGEKALNAIRPLLRNPDWPLPVKVALIRTLVMSVMIYGAEWVGYKQLHAMPIKRVLSKALKLAMGNSSKSNFFDYMTLSYELGIPTAEEEQASLRARLSAKLKKTDGIKTWLKILHDQPLRSLQRTWVTTNQRWERTTLRNLQKYNGVPLRPWAAKGHEYEIHTRCNEYRSNTIDDLRDARDEVDRRGFPVRDPGEGVHRTYRGLIPVHYDPVRERTQQVMNTVDAQSKTTEEWEYIANIRDCVLERAMEQNRSQGWKFYNQWGLGATRGYLRASTTYPRLAQGIHWLVRVRCRALPRVKECWNRLIRSGKTPDFEKDKCPLCKETVNHGDEWMHLIMDCEEPQVKTARLLYLKEAMNTIRRQMAGHPGVHSHLEPRAPNSIYIDKAIAIYLIGGVVGNQFDTDYHRGFGQLDELPEGHSTHGFVKIAEFLNKVAPMYCGMLFQQRSPFFNNPDDLVSQYTFSVAGRNADSEHGSSTDSEESTDDEGDL